MPHVHFTFPEPLKKHLEKSVPPRERSQFVRRATEMALQMRHLREILLSKRHVGGYREGSPERRVRNLRKQGRSVKALT